MRTALSIALTIALAGTALARPFGKEIDNYRVRVVDGGAHLKATHTYLPGIPIGTHSYKRIADGKMVDMDAGIVASMEADKAAAQAAAAAALAATIAAIPAELAKAETDLEAVVASPTSVQDGKIATALLLLLREAHPELAIAKEAAK